MSDIVDDIDRLVDEQLAGGEPTDRRYPKCPHCRRDFHHLEVTERIAAMYVRGVYEEDYRVGGDDSAVLCRGSDFIGPMPEEIVSLRYEHLIAEDFRLVNHAMDILAELTSSICGLGDSFRGFGFSALEGAARIGDLAMFIHETEPD